MVSIFDIKGMQKVHTITAITTIIFQLSIQLGMNMVWKSKTQSVVRSKTRQNKSKKQKKKTLNQNYIPNATTQYQDRKS